MNKTNENNHHQEKKDFDVIVIGAGSAGLTLAASINEHGKSVALIDPDMPGGECAYYGCMPSKILLHTAEVIEAIQSAEEVGLEKLEARFNFANLMSYKDKLVGDMTAQGSWEPWEKKQNITVVEERAHFIDDHTVQAGDQRITGDHIVIATGTAPLIPPIDGLDEVDFLTHEQLIGYQQGIKHQPDRLAVLGAGPIGIEMGQFFARLGTEVMLIEREEHILDKEEPYIADALMYRLQDHDGIEFHLNTEIVRVAKDGDEITLTAANGTTITANRLLLATGMRPVTDGLALDDADIHTDDKGFVPVNTHMQTNVPHIFAIGDITGQYLFTHFASHQAEIAAANIIDSDTLVEDQSRVVPWATFTDPAFGRAGMTESQAKAQLGPDRIVVSIVDFADNERAHMIHQTIGHVKLVADRQTHQLLGAHIMGRNADELIHECALAIEAQVPVETLAEMIHVYPTLSESIKSAAVDIAQRLSEKSLTRSAPIRSS